MIEPYAKPGFHCVYCQLGAESAKEEFPGRKLTYAQNQFLYKSVPLPVVSL